MTTRLPIPGSDNGTWGDILNVYLEVSHNSDGTLANDTVGTNQIATGAITDTNVSSISQSKITGLGNSATKDVGTTSGTVAAGDDSRITGAMAQSAADGRYVHQDGTGLPGSVVSGNGMTKGQMLLANGVSATAVDLAAYVDLFGADPTGTIDSSTAVTAAIDYLQEIATATGSANFGRLVFGVGIYKLSVNIGNQSITVEGQGPERTILEPSNQAAPMITTGDGTAYTARGNIRRGFTVRMVADRQYGHPIIVDNLVKGFKYEDVYLDSTSVAAGGGYVGKFIKLHSCYEGEFKGCQHLRGKWAVPIDVDPDTVNPASGVIDQCDTIKFEDWYSLALSGIIVRGPAPGVTGGDMNTIACDGFKAVSEDYLPNFVTSLAASASSGDNSISVASAGSSFPNGINAGDVITISAGYNVECVKVNNVVGTTVNLSQPLEYAHDITDITNFPHGVSVILGGFGISFGTNIHGINMKRVHAESQYAFVHIGGKAATDLNFEDVYQGASYFALLFGSSGFRFGSMAMAGTSIANRVVTTLATYKQEPANLWFEGPFTTPAGALSPVIAPPTPGAAGYGGFMANISSGHGPLSQYVSYSSTDTAAAWQVQRQNAGANAYNSTITALYSGDFGVMRLLSLLTGGGAISCGSGTPTTPNGVSPTAGDYYFRTDTPTTANQRIYICSVGGSSPTWIGII